MKYCIKCKADLNKPGQQWNRLGNDYYCSNCLKCSFCKKSLSGSVNSSPSKPGVISCQECIRELYKPATYDPNAKATCKCGKTSRPAWEWNGSTWDYHVRILDTDCCSMLHDKCECGAEKSKDELLCKSCKQRERERERERESKIGTNLTFPANLRKEIAVNAKKRGELGSYGENVSTVGILELAQK